MATLNQYKSSEHPFAQYVRILGKGKKGSRALTEVEAKNAMKAILAHETLDIQLGAFLMLLRVKEESAEELSGFVQATKSHLADNELKQISNIQVDFDWPTYAGKRRHLPWFLLGIKLLAKQGMRTLLHGTAGHTLNRIYTEDACKTLGIPILEGDLSQISQILDQHKVVYCPLKYLCPQLDDIIHYRNILGLRSPVHTLTRLLNPFNAKVSLQSIFHPGYKPIHQMANQRLGQIYKQGYNQVAVLKGEGGEFERSPESETLIQNVFSGQKIDEKWPKLLEKRQVKPNKLELETLNQVWQARENDIYGEAAVIATVAVALRSYDLALNTKDAEELARNMWQNRLD